jgi:hypothetical protein
LTGRLAATYEHDPEAEVSAAFEDALQLIDDDKPDVAEWAARDLIARFPNYHHGWNCLALVCEARDDRHRAIDCYWKAIEIVRAHPVDNDPFLADEFRADIARLESSDDF